MLTETERAAFEAAMRRAVATATAQPNAGTAASFTCGILALFTEAVFESASESLKLAKLHSDEAGKAQLHRVERLSEHCARLETRLQKLERGK